MIMHDWIPISDMAVNSKANASEWKFILYVRHMMGFV